MNIIAKGIITAVAALAVLTAGAGAANAATGSSTAGDKCSVVVKRTGPAKMSCKAVTVKPAAQAGSRSAMQAPVLNVTDVETATTVENLAVTRPGTVVLTTAQADRFDVLVASGVNIRDAFTQVLAQ